MGLMTTRGGPTGWGDEGERPGRFGLFFIGIWTLFLLQPLRAGWVLRGEARGWLGMAATLAFVVAYLAIFARRRLEMRAGRLHVDVRLTGLKIAALALLGVLVCLCVGQSGTATAVYVCVLCAMTLPNPWGVPVAVVAAGGTFLAGIVVPGWKADPGLLLSMLAATIAVWGIQQMLVRNTQLRLASDENSRLVVADERNRFSRDLHDILGHSLTVITVKAELAHKLLDVDPERARTELADLERLSRDALADVRRAVEGYRELTLPGELTRARIALRAAEIDADLPNSTDEVPGDLRELFAWTIREGVTNVIRHSGARRCTVRLTPASAEVVDDGCGHSSERRSGNGLVGLRERAGAMGATVVTRPAEPQGFSLQVVVPQ